MTLTCSDHNAFLNVGAWCEVKNVDEMYFWNNATMAKYVFMYMLSKRNKKVSLVHGSELFI